MVLHFYLYQDVYPRYICYLRKIAIFVFLILKFLVDKVTVRWLGMIQTLTVKESEFQCLSHQLLNSLDYQKVSYEC